MNVGAGWTLGEQFKPRVGAKVPKIQGRTQAEDREDTDRGCYLRQGRRPLGNSFEGNSEGLSKNVEENQENMKSRKPREDYLKEAVVSCVKSS